MRIRNALPARRAITAAVMAAAMTTAVFAASPMASAKPIRVGAVTGLAVDVTKPADGPYQLDADWSAASNAAEYRIKLVDAVTRATVRTATVAAPATEWSTSAALPAGTSLTLTVTPAASKWKGKAASKTVSLPDLTAPVGVFELSSRVVTTVTVTQQSLSDDVTPGASITRAVRWGDNGDVWKGWPADSTEFQHAYPVPAPGQTELYTMTVRVADGAANTTTYDFQVRIGDEAAPTGGAYAAAPGAAWATLTDVVLTETAAPTDDFSPHALTRSVKWGDAGNVWEAWPAGQTLTHTYATKGSYTPVVRVVDEALNASEYVTSPVVVDEDTVAPVVKIKAPSTGAKARANWATLRGKATDTAGSGVAVAKVRAVEKRAGAWFSYKPAKKKWVKAGTKAAALSKAPWYAASVAPTGAWTAGLSGLRTGTLIVQAKATDRVGNTSAVVTRQQLLTR